MKTINALVKELCKREGWGMSLIDLYAPWIDKYGLVQPEIGTISDNGIRFTCEALLAIRAIYPEDDTIPQHVAVWINDRLNAIESCQRIPGVLQRWPGCDRQEGVDDYYAACAISRIFHRPFAVNAYNHGLSTLGVFKSTEQSKVFVKNGSAFLWLQPAMRVHMKHCAGHSLNCIDLQILKLAINSSSKSNEQDHKILMWFVIKALGKRYPQLSGTISNWWFKLYVHWKSIGNLLGEYYHPAHHSHPNAQLLKVETWDGANV
jgi:hypothetical protein